MLALKILFYVFLFIIFYAYLGYGILLYFLVRWKRSLGKKKNAVDDPYEPEITLFVTAFNENDFVESADKITASATLINDQMDYLKGITLGYDEQIVYAESAHKLVYEDLESAPIVPEQLLTQRRFDDGDNSLWITFQKVQLCGSPHNWTYVESLFMCRGLPFRQASFLFLS